MFKNRGPVLQMPYRFESTERDSMQWVVRLKTGPNKQHKIYIYFTK